MPTVRDLVEPECGQSNALVDLANKIFSGDETKKQNRRRAAVPKYQNDHFVSEFLHDYVKQTPAPSTFDMGSLLQSVKGFGSLCTSTAIATDWIQEFTDTQKRRGHISRSQDELFENVWTNPCSSSEKFLSTLNENKSNDQTLKWSVEYLQEAEQRLQRNQRSDDLIYPDNIEDSQNESQWAGEFAEFLAQKINDENGDNEKYELSEQSDMAEIWKDADGNTDWIKEYTDRLAPDNDKYEFNQNNPYASVENPLVAGKDALSVGDLSNAILYFEAAVHRNPEKPEAWQYLGQAQAENEHEVKTISALNNCLRLEPNNLHALTTLATAYTNEAMYFDGCRTLVRWLQANPTYSTFSSHFHLSNEPKMSFLDNKTFRDVEKLFLDALKYQGPAMDPELQNAMGVLYNMSGEMEKAADCFRTALSVKPADPRLWNRLGATVANGQKSADAIYAYRKALELYPAFVRARYNLGVSCHNLGSHEQAVEHFISALTLQQNGIGPKGKLDMSQTIWGTLRMACTSTTRSDKASLLHAIDDRNFEQLKTKFSQNASL